ncbi:7TM diverse intracellular signaling domain-containing protein [uncultured Algoriphagus sp.]|uniref:sensor histidine kinase n=1 Tax=uncultured Algoriphagus sp. TaxID=417365 RepID=UPI0030ED829A|tara:strand:+ start:7094 stop:9193 length:2100 start_codon:yes stop_codon:yes gene_type:complete
MSKIIFIVLLAFTLLSCTNQTSGDFQYIGYTSSVDDGNEINPIAESPKMVFEEVERPNLLLGYSDSVFWIKLVLHPKFSEEEKLQISFNNPMLNEVDVYDNRGALISELGRVNYTTNDFNSLYNKVTIPVNASLTYYVRVKSLGNIIVPIEIEDSGNPGFKLDEKNVLFGIYFGIVLAMFFYNMFLWSSTRDYLYGIYILYIFLEGITQGILGGYVDAYFWPNSVFMKENSFYLSTVLVSSIGIFYSLKFLNIKKLNRKLHSVGLGILFVYFLIFLTFIFEMRIGQLNIKIMQALLGLVSFYLLSISIYSLKRGYRPAKFFLISWSLLIISMIIFLLTYEDILPHNFFTNYVFTIGFAFEAILLSFALADKINILKKEKEKEQSERLKALAENEQLIREQNVMLEDKVKIRTDELEQALRNLQNTQSQLVNQEKMASLGQLTAGIAHEINNPINFVSSNIMPLKRDIKDIMEVIEFYRATGAKEFTPDTQKEAKQLEQDLELDYVLEEVNQLLKGMDDGARRTVEIVKGLRLFSRVDEQDMKKVDLHDGINSTIILLNSTMPTKIRIVRDFGELPLVECLAGKINQVFMNIINNAVHALADHIDTIADPIIEVRTRSLGEFVSIEIIDNGPGMPEHVKQRVFEPFFTTKAVGKGTGLGLSIVYSIIENHKGTLEVITEESQGTTFKITLPIYQSTQRHE